MVMPRNGRMRCSWYTLCLVLCLGCIIPAGAVTINQVENGIISPDDAQDIADATLVEFILSGSPGLESGLWDNAVIGEDPVVIHDLTGQPLFFQFPVLKDGISVGTIKASASTVLPSSVIAMSLKPPYYTQEEVTKSAEAFLLREYPGSEILSTSIICYSYPKIGQKISFIPEKGSNPQEIILDISTGEPVDDTATWSYYRAIPESAIIKNRDQWIKERAIDSTVLAEARKGRMEKPSSLQDIDLQKLAGTLRSIPEYGTWIDTRFNQGTTDAEITDKAGSKTLSMTLHPQQKDTWCTVATIQMISEYYGFSFTQSYIAQKTHTTGSDGTITVNEIAFFKDYVNQKDTHSDSSETFEEERAELAASRPFDSSVYSGKNVHARVCAGYDDNWGRSRLYIYDPWPVNGGDIYWESFSDQSHFEDVFIKGGSLGPVASFTYTVNGKTVTFKDTSTGSPTAWYWTFGDGTTASTQNPSHTYSNTGSYTVTLTASNNVDSSSASASVNIIGSATSPIYTYKPPTYIAKPLPTYIAKPLPTYIAKPTIKPSVQPSSSSSPVASFTHSVNGNTVTFKDTSTGNPTKWAWTFGDGMTSSVQNPSHTYSNEGTYTVTLQASNSAGSSSTSSSVKIVGSATSPTYRYTRHTYSFTRPTNIPQPTIKPSVQTDPSIIVKTYSVGSTLIDVSYPKEATPVIIYKNGLPDKYRWDYSVTFKDCTGDGFSFQNKQRYYYTASGELYTTRSEMETYEEYVKPYDTLTDEQWLQCSYDECTFCGGKVKFTYYGQNNYGTSFEIPVNINLKSP